jgi:CHAD domain-containing protein
MLSGLMDEGLAQTRPISPLPAPSLTSVPASGPVLKATGNKRLASTLIRRKTVDLFRHLPLALTGDEEAIHQLRVSGRRLRVALMLLAGKPDGRRAERAHQLLRQLTRTAGLSRDLDIVLETYDEHLKALPSRTREQKVLHHRLASARRRGRGRMVDSLLDLEISRLRSDLAALIARGGPPPSVVCERFAATSQRELCFLQEGCAKLGPRLDAEHLHVLRRRARRVRYAVEVFDQVRSFESAATKPWKILQDLIGVIHDHHVLANWFDGQAKADRNAGKGELSTTASDEASWARLRMGQLYAQLVAANPIAIVARGLAALGKATPSD